MFSLNRKVKDLVPYDPIEGTYRIRLDANESYITLPLEIKEEIAQTVKDIHFNRPVCLKCLRSFCQILRRAG